MQPTDYTANIIDKYDKYRTYATWPLRLLTFIFAAFIGSLAEAHHSRAAVDDTKTMTIVGTVKEFQATNPHSWLIMLVPNAAGGTDEWPIEGPNQPGLRKMGLKPDDLRMGAKISVEINPMRSGKPGGVMSRLILADGRVLRGPFGPFDQDGEAPGPGSSTPGAVPPKTLRE